MSFLQSVLQAIPAAAASPLALAAYAIAVVASLLVVFRVSRSRTLLSNLEKLPEADRRAALADEMGVIYLKEGATAEEWLRSKLYGYYFYGFLIIASVALTVFVISFFMANEPQVLTRLDFEELVQRNRGNLERCITQVGPPPLMVLYLAASGAKPNINVDVYTVSDPSELNTVYHGHMVDLLPRLSISNPDANGCIIDILRREFSSFDSLEQPMVHAYVTDAGSSWGGVPGGETIHFFPS